MDLASERSCGPSPYIFDRPIIILSLDPRITVWKNWLIKLRTIVSPVYFRRLTSHILWKSSEVVSRCLPPAVFIRIHHLQRRCLSPSVLLLPYSGMCGSLIPAKPRSFTTHSASTGGPRVGGVVDSWGQRLFETHAPHFHFMVLNFDYDIQL